MHEWKETERERERAIERKMPTYTRDVDVYACIRAHARASTRS